MLASRILVLNLALFLVCNARTVLGGKNERRRAPTRLLRNVRPLEYDLKLRIDHEKEGKDFVSGTIDIYVEFLAADRKRFQSSLPSSKLESELLDTITLNADGSLSVERPKITFDKSIERLRLGGGKQMQIEEISWNTKMALLALTVSPDLPAGSYGRISLEFSQDSRTITGLKSYPNWIAGPDGDAPAEFINTRLQQAMAHHIFPCFDAPRFRAKVSLAIEADSRLVAYSNMPVVKRVDSKQVGAIRLKRTIFKQTPPMPIHKLTITIGDYDEPITLETNAEPEIRVITPRGWSKAGFFALKLARETFDWLTSKLSTQLPIQKLDIIATNLGSMNVTEALGCILIQQDFLLIDEDESSPERKILASLNVAQVMAQQWFGNLISPARWTYNWVTEGIAIHLAIEMLDELRPSFGVRHYVHSHLLPRIMRLKAFRAMRDPKIKAPQSEEDLIEALDSIKSASIMSMLQNLIGRDQLLAAIKLMLSKNTDGLVTLDDFTESLSKASNDQVTQVKLDKYLMLWKDHPSFPLISVVLDQTKLGSVVVYQSHIEQAKLINSDSLMLSSFQDAVQLKSRLLFSNSDGSKREIVALSLDVFRKSPTTDNPMSGLVRVPLPEWFDRSSLDSGHWVKLESEPDELSFYCVRYANDLVERMKPAIQGGSMSVSDRVSLLKDASVLTQMGNNLLSDGLLEVIMPWFSVADGGVTVLVEELQAKRSQMGSIQGCTSLDLCPLQNFRRIYEKYGFATVTNESTFEQFVRGAILSDMIMDDDPQVIDSALNAFDAGQSAPFLRGPIYAAVVKGGSPTQLQRLASRLEAASWTEEQERLRFALWQTRELDIVKTFNSWSKYFRRILRKNKSLVD